MEATHADESHIWWLISRLRTDANLNPSIWLSCNPDNSSYLFEWVKWWLYPEDHPNYGLPDPEKNGKIRYILRVGGNIFWGDTEEEMYEKYGKRDSNGNLFPKGHPDQIMPLTFQVLLGTIYDNPVLMAAQPEYKHMLESLPDLARRRLLLGDWNAKAQSESYWDESWLTIDDQEPPQSEIVKTVRAYDLAGTIKSEGMSFSPDYSASCKMSKLKNGQYFIHDIRRCRIRFGDWKRWILENAMMDGKHVDVILPIDPNPAAKAATSMLATDLSSEGLYVRTFKSCSSKLDRFRPLSSAAQNGGVRVLRGCGYDLENKIEADLKFVWKEFTSFDGKRRGGESGHDDKHTCRR